MMAASATRWRRPLLPVSLPSPSARWLLPPLAILLIALAASSATPRVPVGVTAGRIERLTNVYRVEAGLPALRSSPELSRAAHVYAEQMASAGWFDHAGPAGSTLVTRAEAAGYTDWRFLAENLAQGDGAVAPGDVVDAWLGSPEHRANALSAEVTETGAACARVAERAQYWCVQLFGSR